MQTFNHVKLSELDFELESETINIEDIEQAYEVGLEDDVYKDQGGLPNEQNTFSQPNI